MIDRSDLELFERSIRHAVDNHEGEALDAALEKLGWDEALGTDRRVAVSVLFESQGRANTVSSALDRVLVAAAGVESALRCGVVWPTLGGTSPPGERHGGRITVRGLARMVPGHSGILAVARSGDKQVAGVLPTTELARRAILGMDPRLALSELTGDAPATDVRPVDWSATVAVAQLAIGHEIVGASRRMLELAREHALDRVQFGRPISAFQAVRHRLADTLVAIEMADALLDAAWLQGAPPGAAAMAKAAAGRAGRIAARQCQQVLAGIGFTSEHPLASYIRRVLVLDQLFGNSRLLAQELGRQVLDNGRLPPVLPL
jgi:hypothetical protein